MTPACTACARTLTPDLVRDHRHACRTCTDTARATLAEIPVQLAALAHCLEPAGGGPRTGSTHAAPALSAPARTDALNLLAPGLYRPGLDDPADAPARALLTGWATVIADHTGFHARRTRHGRPVTGTRVQPRPRHLLTTEAWCDWHSAYLPTAARHPWTGHLYHDLATLLTRIRRITLLHPWEHTLPAPCPRCRAYDLTAAWGRTAIHCGACGHTLTPGTYRTHAADHARTRLHTITGQTRRNEQNGQDAT